MTRRGAVAGYLTSYLLDRAVDGLFYVALAWLAARASGPLGAAAIIGAGSVPRVVMLLLGGVVADRYGLASTARVTLVLRVGLLVVFALASTSVPNALLLALVAASFGAVDALHMPAITGLSGLLVEGGGQVRLQGAMTSIGNAVEIVAAPSAAVLLAWASPSVGWVGAGLLAVAALTVPSAAAVPTPDHGERESVVEALRSVLAYARRDRVTRSMLAVFAVANLAATPAIGLGIALLLTNRNAGEGTYGALMMAFAVGSVLGGFALARWGERMRFPARASLLLMIPGGMGLAALALVHSAWAGVAATGLTGLCFASGAGLLMGNLKAATPPALMGRMMSLIQVSVYCLIPAGMLLFGALSAHRSPATAMATAGGITLATAVLGLAAGPLGSYQVRSVSPETSIAS